ncbi:MAG TPA: TldD/PmbA family protein [Gemmatimonadales bacterium]|nr:TldD/PmbA family protein [Gemmatimonadales bacterium]
MDRRQFVATTTATTAALALPAARAPALQADAGVKELCLRAIDTARAAGASYADCRVQRNRNQSVSTREQQITGLVDSETFGFGVRVLADGAWGFAASRELSPAAVDRVARLAVAQARANRRALKRPVRLAPVEPVADGRWRSPIEIDPFAVPVEDKVALLLKANAEALKVSGARFVNSSMFFVLEEKTFASTDGVFTVQHIYRCLPQMTVTAVDPATGDFQSRESVDLAPMGLGYEWVLQADLPGRAPGWAEDAVRKLSARPVAPGRYDLILEPHHLWLTIHESIAHPTELDRALGYEANYAGTSFAAPPERVLGQLKWGPEFMNIQGDRSQPGSLSACGWDDDGVAPETYLIVKNGVLVDYQTTRDQVAWIQPFTGRTRSHGCSYAESWADVQFQRMPNVSLLPGEEDLTLDDLIAATDHGIYIVGDGSYSIDQQRYNFQFGGQVFYEVKGGKITGMLKDVAYQARNVDFWSSMDLIGGPRSYRMNGTFSDGKGQPGQSNAVSHGCPPARFRQVNVLNTGRSRG